MENLIIRIFDRKKKYIFIERISHDYDEKNRERKKNQFLFSHFDFDLNDFLFKNIDYYNHNSNFFVHSFHYYYTIDH